MNSEPINVDPEKLVLPPDYDDIFNNRILFITGSGRSGTTIFARFLCSHSPVCYIHEPQILRSTPVLFQLMGSGKHQVGNLLKAVLFEDHILQRIHGRNVNFNELDISFAGNYEPITEVKERWSRFRRRADVIEYLTNEKILIVVKMPDIQPVMEALKKIFNDALFIHCIRNGLSVIGSSLHRRGWYTQEYFDSAYLDWCARDAETGSHVPWIIDHESRKLFVGWNNITKAACLWRTQGEAGVRFAERHPESIQEIHYEKFMESVHETLQSTDRWIDARFGIQLKPTPITEKALEATQKYDYRQYESVEDRIEEPELEKFQRLMRFWKYANR